MTSSLPPPEWNETSRPYPDTLLHEAFSAQVVRTPGAPALAFRDEVLTYAQLDERVARVAAHLLALGVGPGTLVGVCLERSPEMVVALHAILRAGGAYVPIDPEYPDERIALVLDDLDEPILLTQQKLSGRLAGAAARVVPLETLASPAPESDRSIRPGSRPTSSPTSSTPPVRPAAQRAR